jgi:DNA-binding MarR family transcriptional regulator
MIVTIHDNHPRVHILIPVSEHQPAPHAESLSFLVSQVGARSAQLFAARLAPLGVSPRAFGVLSNLGSTGGQTQQQLADALGIHRNNMVGLIDELEAAGWVRRHRSQRDRRAFDVRLTRAGSALVSRIGKLIPVLDGEVGQGLTETERHTVVALLQRMASTLDLRPGVHPGLSGPSRAAVATRRPEQPAAVRNLGAGVCGPGVLSD